METEIRYIKPNEEYQLRRQEPIPEVRRVPLWLLIPLALLMILGGYLVFTSLGIEERGQTTYNVSGDVDYQVYLKNNDYYNTKYLESGKQYIANLIDTIRVDYEYTLDANDAINANYTYEILATAVATDKNNKSQILYEQTDQLKSVPITPIRNGSFSIRDNVNLDYGQYSEHMRSFRSDFGIAANCFLTLKLVVRVDGSIKTEDTLALNIPLSDQTMNINISTDGITRTEKVGEAKPELYVKNLSLLIVGSIIAVASLASGMILIYLHLTRFGDDWYAETEYKINKNYDTHIVNATTSYHEQDEVVKVGEFIELIDASRNEGAPIVRYEVEPGYKTYYVVDASNGLKTYRYTLTRAYQDELRQTGQPKERLK